MVFFFNGNYILETCVVQCGIMGNWSVQTLLEVGSLTSVRPMTGCFWALPVITLIDRLKVDGSRCFNIFNIKVASGRQASEWILARLGRLIKFGAVRNSRNCSGPGL